MQRSAATAPYTNVMPATASRILRFMPHSVPPVIPHVKLRAFTGADDSRAARLRQRLNVLEKEQANIVEGIQKGVLVDALTSRPGELEAEQADVERQLQELENSSAPSTEVGPDDLMRYYRELPQTLRHGSLEDRKKVARLFIKELSVNPETRAVDLTIYDPKVGGYLVAPRVSTRLGNPY